MEKEEFITEKALQQLSGDHVLSAHRILRLGNIELPFGPYRVVETRPETDRRYYSEPQAMYPSYTTIIAQVPGARSAEEALARYNSHHGRKDHVKKV